MKLEQVFKEGRAKIASIGESQLLSIFPNETSKEITVPVLALPKGYCVAGVHLNFRRRSFEFTVYHESFPPTEPSEELPSLNILNDVAKFKRVLNKP